jgi:hypothetical protein
MENVMSFIINDEFVIKDSDQVDPFGRMRATTPLLIFSSVLETTDQEGYNWHSLTNGTASYTYLPFESSVELSIGTDAGDYVERRTLRNFQYQSSYGMTLYISGVIGTIADGCKSEIGFKDDDNGLFFRYTVSNGLSVVRRYTIDNTGVDEDVVTQSNFNLDKLDGTGPSGYNIDLTKTQIFFVDYGWLGVGRIRYGVFVNGKVIFCHEIETANLLSTVYMGVGSLPVAYRVENLTATSSSSEIKQICAGVSIDGGRQEIGRSRGFPATANNFLSAPSGATWYNVISVRIDSNYPYVQYNFLNASIVNTANSVGELAIIKNGDISGFTWSSDGEFAEISETQDPVTNGNILASSVYERRGDSQIASTQISDRIALRADNTSETLTLAARGADGSVEVTGGLNLVLYGG